jgi:hypothetical protein
MWLPAGVMVLNLLYLDVAPADADPNLVRYRDQALFVRGQPLLERIRQLRHGAWSQPVDVLLCYPLGGLPVPCMSHRTLVDHAWDEKAIVGLRGGEFYSAKALAAIDGLVLRDRSFRCRQLDPGARAAMRSISSPP